MKCPSCGNLEDKVIDSRATKDGDAIRRRRECLKCGKRFTSYEHVEEVIPMIIKKDARREPFDRTKILAGLRKACEKRPISIDALEGIADSIEKKLPGMGVKEVHSTWVGEEIMSSLKDLDKVAYVRFASVYRQFKDISELLDEVKNLFEHQVRHPIKKQTDPG